MADLNSLISLKIQLESTGEQEAANKVSAAIEKIQKTQQVAADFQDKATDSAISGNTKLVAKYTELAAAADASANRQVKAALNIGSAFQKTNKDLEQLANKELAKSIEGIGKAFDSVVTSLANGQAPINAIKEGISKIGELASQVFGPEAQVVAQVASSFITLGQALVDVTIHAGEAQRQLDLIAGSTGLKPETVAAVRTAAQAIGASYLQVVAAADKFSEAQIKANEGNAKSIEVFAKLNVSIKDLNGNLKNNDDLFREAIAKFAALPGGAEKAALGYELFGLRSEKAILAIGANLDKLRQQAIDAGLVLDEKGAQSLRNFNEAAIELGNFIEGLRVQIGAFVSDTLTGLAKEAVSAIKALKADPGVVLTFQAIGTAILTLVQIFGGLAIELVRFAGFLVGIPANIENFIAKSKALRVVLGVLTGGLSELAIAFINFRNETSNTNKIIDEQIKLNQEAIAKEEAKRAALEKTRLAMIEGTEENKKAQAEAKKQFEEQKAQNAASIADFKQMIQQKIEQQKLFVQLGIRTEQQADEEIKKLKKDALDYEIGIFLQQRTAAQNAAKINKDLLKEVANTNKQISKAKIDLSIEEEKQIVDARKKASAEIILTYDLEKQARLKQLQDAIAGINKLEQDGTLNHAQAAMARAMITEQEIKNEIAQEEAKSKDIRLSDQEQEKAKKEAARLTTELAKQQKDDEVAYHKAVTKDLEEELAKRKKLEEGLKEQVKSYIFELVQKDKEAGVSREDTIRRVAQAQLQANEEILASKEHELELLKKDEPDALAKIQDFENQIKQLKIDNGELEKIIKGSVDETSLSYNKQLQAIDKLVGKQEDLTKAVKDTQKAEEDLANKIADEAQKTPIIIGQALDITKLSIQDLQKQIADTIDQLSQIGTASGTAAIAARQGLQDTLAVLQQEYNNRVLDAFNKANQQYQEAADKQAAEALAKEEKEAEDFINIQNMIVDARKKAADDSKKVADNFNKEVKSAQDSFYSDSEKAKEAFDKRIADEDKQAAAAELDRLRQLEIDKRNLANAARDQALADATKTILDRSKLEKAVKDASSPEEKKKAQEELDKFNKAAIEKDQLTKQKAADIDKARRESKTKEEFDAKVKAINDQYQLDVDAITQRQQLIDDGNAAELDALNASIAAQKAQRQKELQDELNDIATTQKQQKQAADDKRQAEIDAYNQEQSDRKTAFQQKIFDLQMQAIMEQAEIKKNLDTQVMLAETAAKMTAAAAGLSQQAYEALFAAIKKGALDAAQALAVLTGATPFPGGAPGSSGQSGSSTGTGTSGSGVFGGAGSQPAPGQTSGIGGPAGNNNSPTFFIKKAGNNTSPPPTPSGPSGNKSESTGKQPSGQGNAQNTGGQDNGIGAQGDQSANLSASSPTGFAQAMTQIYKDRKGQGGNKTFQIIYDKVKEFATSQKADPKGPFLIIQTDQGGVQLNSKANDLTVYCGNEDRDNYFATVKFVMDAVMNAAMRLADNKKVEQTNVTPTQTPTGDFNNKRGSKDENNPERKGKGGKTATGAKPSGEIIIDKDFGKQKSNADISRGDTQIDEAAQRESDMLAALRGIQTATNNLNANMTNQTASMEQNNNIVINAPSGNAQDIKKVVEQVLAEQQQKLKQQAPGVLETS